MPAQPSAATRKLNPDAYDAYLRGRYFFQKQDWEHSASSFQQATALDPTYASAYAGLASALDAQTTFRQSSPGSALQQALAATGRAIQLDPQNGEAYTELGSLQTIYQWNWPAAEQNLLRGIALNPSDALAEMKYAAYLDANGRPQEAVNHMRRAVELDPMSFFMRRCLGRDLILARRYDEGLAELNRAAEMEPEQQGSVEMWISVAYELKGMRDEAVQHDLALLNGDSPANLADALGKTYRQQGWQAYWRARIDARRPYRNLQCEPYWTALSYLRLGDYDRTFAQLDQVVDQHCYLIVFFKSNPLLDPIRNDPRYDTLLERIHLSR